MVRTTSDSGSIRGCGRKETWFVGGSGPPGERYPEESTVNRPFYAFGVLLALLALAMVAVSSTSRCTTVQAQPAAAEGSLLSPVPHGTIFVVVLPEAEEASEPDLPAAADVVPSQIVPAVILPVEYDTVAKVDPQADCRSQHDRTYDELVYGEADFTGANDATPPVTDVDELLSLFHSLAGPAPQASHTRASLQPWKSAWHRLQTSSTPILLGTRNWIARLADRWLPASREEAGPAMNWYEYTDLMGSIPAASEPLVQAAPPAEIEPVRSGGWLLHFAVSSLSQAGLTLQQAAAELQQLENDVSPSPTAAVAR